MHFFRNLLHPHDHHYLFRNPRRVFCYLHSETRKCRHSAHSQNHEMDSSHGSACLDSDAISYETSLRKKSKRGEDEEENVEKGVDVDEGVQVGQGSLLEGKVQGDVGGHCSKIQNLSDFWFEKRCSDQHNSAVTVGWVVWTRKWGDYMLKKFSQGSVNGKRVVSGNR